MQMHDARIERSASLETSVREYVEHLPILAQHVGFKLLDAVSIRNATQMLQQDRGDAVSLELVQNRKRNLSTLRIGAANITAHTDDPLVLAFG